MFPLLIYFNRNDEIVLLSWVYCNRITKPFELIILLDKIGIIFLVTVFLISSSVIWFSNLYIRDEIEIKLFLFTLILFILSIVIFIFLPNFLSILLGWDGLGLSSYLLVLYYRSPRAVGGRLTTAISNRFGDVFLLISIFLLRDSNWLPIIQVSNEIILVCLFIILAAITKRAQWPFSVWLPAAMAAPTPVSALVHSSTLVTAGAFLLIRFSNLINSFNLLCFVLCLFSSWTLCLSGFNALFETDLKKIVALSTLGQIRTIIYCISIGLINLAFFHLITHALIKALLFICVGYLIIFNGHSQDSRRRINDNLSSPIISSCILFSLIRLCGFPFLAAFYSKDLIINITSCLSLNWFPYIIFCLGRILTSAYSVSFLMKNIWYINCRRPVILNKRKVNFNLVSPLLILSISSIWSGPLIIWLFVSPLFCVWSEIPFLIIGRGIIIGLISSFSYSSNFYFANFGFLSQISCLSVPLLFFNGRHFFIKNLDNGWIEYSVNGIGWQISSISRWIDIFSIKSFNTNLFIFLTWITFWVIYLI